MVKFELIEKSDAILRYKYYPEGDTTKMAGIIFVDRKLETIETEVPAEGDFMAYASVSELNKMRNAINQIRKMDGREPLTEEELPTATEDSEWLYYADHAIRTNRSFYIPPFWGPLNVGPFSFIRIRKTDPELFHRHPPVHRRITPPLYSCGNRKIRMRKKTVCLFCIQR